MPEPEPTSLLEVRGLRVAFRRGLGGARGSAVEALAGIDLDARAGEIVGVLGPNGSGKTTLLRVLAGELLPSAGEARVLDRSPTDPALARLLGYQPDGPMPFPRLAVGRVLRELACLTGMPAGDARDRADAWLARVGLAAARSRPVGALSTGMRKRFALAAALVAEPRVLLLDEPTSGLDPTGSPLVLDLLREHAARGGTALVASHHLQEVEQVCDRVVVLHTGRIATAGTLDELLGTDETHLVLSGLPTDRRAPIEAAARAAGAEIRGWQRGRRHLFALFRELVGSPRTDEPASRDDHPA